MLSLFSLIKEFLYTENDVEILANTYVRIFKAATACAVGNDAKIRAFECRAAVLEFLLHLKSPSTGQLYRGFPWFLRP